MNNKKVTFPPNTIFIDFMNIYFVPLILEHYTGHVFKNPGVQDCVELHNDPHIKRI